MPHPDSVGCELRRPGPWEEGGGLLQGTESTEVAARVADVKGKEHLLPTLFAGGETESRGESKIS